MGRIPEETIQDIKDRIDIVGLIGRYVDLKKAGRNFKGRCPFHDEKTPSFNVNPERQAFYCFGCQAGGNAFGFLMRHESLTFPEAARTLAKECGIEIPDSQAGGPGIGEQLFAANEIAQRFYRASLASPEGEPARAYLSERGIDNDAIERFGIGFAPNRWEALGGELRLRSVEQKIGIAAGLSIPRDSERPDGGSYDRLRGRIIFPIRDVRDRIMGFGGRAIFPDQEPKYINTPETPIFHKRSALYGFPFALEGIRKADRAIVCEGYFDRIALDRAGLKESLATCGTALTRGHGDQLRRRVREVVLLFDGDEAGQNAVEKALDELLPTGLRVRAALLPPGDDPDSYLLEHGAEALCRLVERSPDAIEIVIRRALKGGYETPSAKAAVVATVAPFVALIQNPIERIEYARRLAFVTDTDASAVEAVVRQVRTSGKSRRGEEGPDVSSGTGHVPVAPVLSGSQERHVIEIAHLIYRHPTVFSNDVLSRVEDLIPEGPWKTILRLFARAEEQGGVEAGGSISLSWSESQVDPENVARLYSLEVLNLYEESPIPPEQIIDDLVGWFERQRRKDESKSLTRQLRDPEADIDALLAKKQRQLEERRAAHRIQTRTMQ